MLTDEIEDEQFNVPACSPRFQRLLFLLVCIVFVLTPFAIARQLDRPSVSQRYFFELAVLLIAVLYSGSRVIGLSSYSPRDLLRPWIILYAIALAVGAAFSPHPRPVFLNLVFPLAGIAFYIGVYGVEWTEQKMLRLTGALAVTVYAASAIGVMQAALGAIPGVTIKVLPYVDRQIPGHMDVLSVFGHPNYATSFLGPALILLVWRNGWFNKRKTRPSLLYVVIISLLGCAAVAGCALLWQTPGTLWLLVIVAAGILAWVMGWFIRVTIASVLLSLLMAGSRGVWLALAIAYLSMIPLWVQTQNWRFARFKSFAWRGIVLLLIAAVLIAVSPLRSYVEKRLREKQAIASRLYAYTIAVDMLRERPWRGWGYGSFSTEYFGRVVQFQQRPGSAIYRNMLTDMNGTPPGEVHNDLLAIAIDAGLPAAFCLLAILITLAGVIVVRSLQMARDELRTQSALLIAMLGAIICIAVDGLFSFPLRLPCSAMMFWGIAAMAARLAQQPLSAPAA